MRIGEILLTTGKVTLEQLDEALEAQATFGGRLGTNLVEMNVLDLDTLAQALGRRHGVPAALAKHFDIIGPHVTVHVTRELAVRYHVVPFGVREKNGKRELWVATMDPQHPDVEDDLAFAAGMPVVISVAPELRVLHALEVHYGHKRPVRYLSVRTRESKGHLPERRKSAVLIIDAAATQPGQPALVEAVVPLAQDPSRIRERKPPAAAAERPRYVTFPPPPEPLPERAAPARLSPLATVPDARMPAVIDTVRTPAALDDIRIDADVDPSAVRTMDREPALLPEEIPPGAAPAEPPSEPRPRLSVQLQAWLASTPGVVPAPEPAAQAPQAMPPAAPAPEPPAATATSAASSPPTQSPPPPSAPDAEPALPDLHAPLDVDAATLRLGLAPTRDHIADVIVDHLRSSFAVGLVLIVRQGIALGWRGFAPGVDESVIANLAIPLTAPSAFARVHESRLPYRGTPPPDGEAMQARLWGLLKTAAPRDMAVFPVLVAGRLVNLVYGQPAADTTIADAAFADLGVVTASAGAAFVRIIKAKKEG